MHGNVKVSDASLKFVIRVPTRKIKFSLFKNQINIANLKKFPNWLSDSAPKLSFPKTFLPFCLFSYR